MMKRTTMRKTAERNGKRGSDPVKISIAYDSKFGNGRKCAEYLQGVLKGKGHDAAVYFIRETDPGALPASDLYVFSTPTHVGTAPFKIKGFLKKANMQKGSKYALITTKIAPHVKTLAKMEEILGSRGMIKVTDGLEINISTMKDPLDKDYMKKLDEFAESITI